MKEMETEVIAEAITDGGHAVEQKESIISAAKSFIEDLRISGEEAERRRQALEEEPEDPFTLGRGLFGL